MSSAVFPGALADHLAGDAAAVDVIPVGSGIVAADGLAVEDQRRDGFAESPGELAVRTGLALVELRADGMERDNPASPGAAIASGTSAEAPPASSTACDKRCRDQRQG